MLLAWNDVFDVMLKKLNRLMNAAILTLIAGTTTDQFLECSVNQELLPLSCRWASALSADTMALAVTNESYSSNSSAVSVPAVFLSANSSI